jgi:hypothetical protein
MDQNNPSVSMVNHLSTVLDAQPELINHYIRIKGTMGLKGELHRRYTTALFGGVQVGVGANTEDFIYEERQYSIRVSTRFNSSVRQRPPRGVVAARGVTRRTSWSRRN